MIVTGQQKSPNEISHRSVVVTRHMATTQEEDDIIVVQQLILVEDEIQHAAKVIVHDTDVFILLMFY